MSERKVEAQAKADAFAAIVLSALTEAARRAAVAYQQRGHLLASWNGHQVEWVTPEDKLRCLDGSVDVGPGESAVEQGTQGDALKRAP